ncbi:helix-turn-helix domain-containing protein [Rickettsia endosymbiont of Gonocerus acuteangulatus]|uniref:helix-turn-helix domain-containing protein n=1 Tax=Rickettsia endosymbiont of Gonocerus acuteangulatus TaxID=3066266 RepID=UPI0031334B9F
MMNRKYRHLSREERYEIKRMYDLGVSINKIAQHLTRSKSTISMELKRNKVKGKYMPCVAQEQYKKRMHQQELLKIEKLPILLNYIKNAMIHKKWSPDAIAGKLKLDKNTACCISTDKYTKLTLCLI